MAPSLTHTRHTAPRRPRVMSVISAIFATWRQRQALGQLDTHLRRDVGLSQSDIAEETRRPIWDVPNHWLK